MKFKITGLAVLALVSMLPVAKAQETPTFQALTDFVSHPTYCAQLLAGDDSVGGKFAVALDLAVTATGKNASQEGLSFVRSQCQQQLLGKANRPSAHAAVSKHPV